MASAMRRISVNFSSIARGDAVDPEAPDDEGLQDQFQHGGPAVPLDRGRSPRRLLGGDLAGQSLDELEVAVLVGLSSRSPRVTSTAATPIPLGATTRPCHPDRSMARCISWSIGTSSIG